MKDRPPAWAILGTVVGAPLFIGSVIVYVPYTITGWRPAPPLLGWAPTRWIGAALALLAVPLLVDFCVRFVREGHGTPMPMAPPRRLVISGPYRFVRNPGYLAALAVVAGQGLWFASAGVLLYALVVAGIFHVFVVAVEEPALHASFGAEYDAYRHRVPRWLPRRRG
jgi:protein-S-isoprenylcysteine O-methyltransferase Ste14